MRVPLANAEQGSMVRSSVIITLIVAGSFPFFFQAEDGIRDWSVTGVQTCALPISEIYTLSTQSTFDLAGNLTEAKAPNGATVSYAYDSANRLATITQSLDSGQAQATITYDTSGNLLEQRDLNGQSTRHAYDARNRRIRTTLPATTSPVACLAKPEAPRPRQAQGTPCWRLPPPRTARGPASATAERNPCLPPPPARPPAPPARGAPTAPATTTPAWKAGPT